MEEEKELLLRETYFSAVKKGMFLTQNQLYEKVHPHSISRQEVKYFLETLALYNKFKRKTGIKQFRKTFVMDLAQQLQIDLVVMSKYKHENNGYQYILVGIEILSRTAFAYPTQNKSAKMVSKALENLLQDFFDRFDEYPETIQFDEGAEFKNREVNALLRQHGIKHFSNHSLRQASLVERLNRTLQEKIRKYWEMENNHEWVSHLSQSITSYNTTFHRSIQMKPNEVSEDNKFIVWGRLFGQVEEKRKKPKFQVGETVRIYHFKLLHRATPGLRKYYRAKYGPPKNIHMVQEKYEHPFSDELFRITHVKIWDGNIIVYKLRNEEAHENILGYFYEEELSRVR